MKKYFPCSFCHNGILGGWLTVTDDCVTYSTGKVTIDPQYRHFPMPLADIDSITWKWIVFPVATFTLKDGSAYKFLIFNKWRFEKTMEEVKNLK